MADDRSGTPSQPVKEALRRARKWFYFIAAFSTGINLLMLTGSLYMLQVYDRVLASGSLPTLIVLSLMALIAYCVQGALEAVRSRMLIRIGGEIERELAPRVFDTVTSTTTRNISSAEALGPERDLEAIRSYLAGLGPTALLDMPFMPLFFCGCFILHPALGWLAVGGGLIVISSAVLLEKLSAKRSKVARDLAVKKLSFMEASRRNAECVVAMGLRPALGARWAVLNEQHTQASISLGDVSASVGSFVKSFRMMLQSAVIGLGGYLAINGEITAGAIIAANVMLSRGLAPIETAVAHWKNFIAFRHGFTRLSELLAAAPDTSTRTELPAPRQALKVENLCILPAGAERFAVKGVDFEHAAGSALCITGPSASGKSSLARALVGVWPAAAGVVRLDGAALDQWSDATLGRHIGYLPQDIELFEGTIAENISRFDPSASAEGIIAAGQAANAHEMIVALPNGYDTRIGEDGMRLSGGQRQRIALARALYGNPFLIVLDEPNSNLDGEGERALNAAILQVRQRGGIAIIITHRSGGSVSCNYFALMQGGCFADFGRREEFIQRQSSTAKARIAAASNTSSEKIKAA